MLDIDLIRHLVGNIEEEQYTMWTMPFLKIWDECVLFPLK